MNITSLGGKSLFCANMIKDLELRRKIWIIWVRVNVIIARKMQRENTHIHTHTHTHTHTHRSKQYEDAAEWPRPEWWLHSLDSRRSTQLWESMPSVLLFLYFIHFCSFPWVSSVSADTKSSEILVTHVYILWILWESTPLATRTLCRFFLGKCISIPAFCWDGQLNP